MTFESQGQCRRRLLYLDRKVDFENAVLINVSRRVSAASRRFAMSDLGAYETDTLAAYPVLVHGPIGME